MKNETYREMERRLEQRAWIGITIALLLPLVPIILIYFLGV